MTKNEMLIRIENLKFDRMCLACKDRWNKDDYKKDDELLTEIRALQKAINED